MTINTVKKSQTEKTKHLNWMGGNSWFLSDPVRTLQLAASSSFFGEPQYYHREKGQKLSVKNPPRQALSSTDLSYLRDTLDAVDPQEWRSLNPTKLMETAIDNALDHNPERTLQLAVELRQNSFIRVTPQVILVRAAHRPKLKGTGLIRKYASQIIQRADEPATGYAYHLSKYGKKVPTSLKRAWADALQKFSEYQLGKYQTKAREVKLVDVVNITHPKGPAIDKLMRGELNNTGKTWEAIISEKGSDQAAWLEALDVMGHMSLLRNLRNLQQKGVPQDLFLTKLVEGAAKGKQLPFRYWSAYNAVKSDPASKANSKLLDTIEECLMRSLKNLPTFTGRVMSLVDNSGSARNTATSSLGSVQISTIGNLSGILTGLCSEDGQVGVFGDRLETFPVRKKSSVFDTLEQADRLAQGVGQATENGIWLFWDTAIREQQHWDVVFVYSDMQAGHGGLYGINSSAYSEYRWNKTRNIDVPKLINKYRSVVNPHVKVFLVQIAGYQDTIIPEFYKDTYIIGGWGDGVLSFAGEMIRLAALRDQNM